ncbi:MAG: hypothetical protein AAB321_03530 [Chloroflexota bacterium]
MTIIGIDKKARPITGGNTMSMQALNQLVARSIIDPGVVQAFRAGRIGEVLDELGFTTDLRAQLSGIESDSWAEFAVISYRYVKSAEAQAPRLQFPSPVEGLLATQAQADQEQVA